MLSGECLELWTEYFSRATVPQNHSIKWLQFSKLRVILLDEQPNPDNNTENTRIEDLWVDVWLCLYRDREV